MLRASTQRYSVTRPLYSEDTFEDEHAKVYRKHKRLLDHFIQYFTCTSERAKNAAVSLLPIIGWVKIYSIKEWLLNDIVSGVSTGLVAVLQGLAFSLLASISTWYGLYAAFFPVIMYFFLGTSRHISVGSFPVLSLMVGAVVTRLVPDEGTPANITAFEGLTKDEQRILVSASLTFLVGLFQLGMGLLQVGFIVMYLSDTLISGFTTAAAVHILVSQLKFVLGLTVPGFSGPLSIIYTLESVFTQITSTNIHDLVTSIVVMVTVLGVKEINDRFKSKLPVPIPIEVIMTIIACGVSYAFNFSENHGVDVVGKIPNTFESPIAPSLQVFQMTAVEAFPIAIVGFAVAFAVAKVYSVKHDYIIDGNQELIAFGASNIFGGAFKSLAASTALSRSAVQESTGGKTQIAGLISAVIVLIVILGIGFLLEPLPKSVLGAVVIVNLKGMLMQVVTVPYLWKKDRPDCIVWVGTCLAAIFLGLDIGLAVGLGLELLTVVFRAQFPRCCVLANISGTDIYRDRKDYVNIYEPEGVKIFRIPSPIFFANIEFFRDKLKDAVGFNPLRILRKRNKAVKKIKKMIKKGELILTPNGLQATCSMPIEESEDESNMEDLDKPTDFSDLPIQVNWNAELPANIRVPPVNIHSLILDFSAVSFLDISALKGLKAALKEFIRINVDVYIVGCDPYIIEKLKNCKFFDDEIKTSIFFLTIHDAMLFIHESHPPKTVSAEVSYQHINSVSKSSGMKIQAMDDMKMEVEKNTKPETRFMQPFGRHYVVVRPLFSEDSFSEQHKKINRNHKTLRHHLKDYFTCDRNRAKNAALSLLPIIGWMKNYNVKEWLLGDIVSGISTGLVAVLQGLAFSLLASLPPGYGLYTAFFPAIIYFFLGTSRHLSVGAFPILSLMVGAVVTRLVPDNGPAANITGFEGLTMEQQRVLVASSVTFVMGAFQLIMGLLQVGFIVMYLSETLVSGFTTAAAVHILVSQLRFVLGLNFPGINGPLAIVYTLENVFGEIVNTNVADLVTSIVIMALVLIVKEINDRFKAKLPVPIPIEVIMVGVITEHDHISTKYMTLTLSNVSASCKSTQQTVIACGVSYAFNFEKRFNVTVVGEMVEGYEPPIAPNLEVIEESAVEAFPMAIVGFAVAFSVAKVYSVKHDYTIDGNQELLAFGVSNIFGASFRSFAASTALSRTAIQESTGGKTQIAGVLSAMMVLIVTVAVGFLLEPLPRSVLGALVIVNLKGMLMQFRELPFLWKNDRTDFVTWVVTFLASLFLGLDLGLAVGLGAELFTVVCRTQFPRCSLLANITGTDIYRDRKDYSSIYEPDGVKIFKIPSPLFFANIDFFRDKLVQAVGFSPLKVLKKRNKALRKIRKMLCNGELEISDRGLKVRQPSIDTSEYNNNSMEGLDEPIDFSGIPIQVNWNTELPANISVPPVNIHSLVLDFSAVSFLDISALKGLKATLKEFIRIEVDVYIVSCDVYIMEKLHRCSFFDDEIKTSIFYPSLHDAMLHILEMHPDHGDLEKDINITYEVIQRDSITV
ncbi:solute carrier family 26 member 3, tandem duplicate 2 [Puntigrus tetrazona]|uniref:solute carrier family 26 member 3, tandem duplicate 2 n=1 Tax=Puntigrus tetrazona TaxID=1606681 RepID=UPI001C88F38A|nr:solute carrier family 26 member 3, tandem duplicate 2 [Puntigrus tetrazona]